MPNGGPDNCGNCGFNRRNRGIWRNPSPDETQKPFCEIRGVAVEADLWTYCQNWHSRTREPIGPIYASGLYDHGYHRIPWHGSVEPQVAHTGYCCECRSSFSDGIAIPAVEGAALEFCGNLHYLRWWKRQHPDEDPVMSGSIGDRE